MTMSTYSPSTLSPPDHRYRLAWTAASEARPLLPGSYGRAAYELSLLVRSQRMHGSSFVPQSPFSRHVAEARTLYLDPARDDQRHWIECAVLADEPPRVIGAELGLPAT